MMSLDWLGLLGGNCSRSACIHMPKRLRSSILVAAPVGEVGELLALADHSHRKARGRQSVESWPAVPAEAAQGERLYFPAVGSQQMWCPRKKA